MKAARAAWQALIVGALPVAVVAASRPMLSQDLAAQVGFEQMLGARVPPDVSFRDTDGTAVRLGDIAQGKPTLLVPGYYRCLHLCEVVRAGVAQAVVRSGLKAGNDFNVVLFSIDPRDTPQDALSAQRADARAYPAAQVARWHYLTGPLAAGATLARAIGFHYQFDSRSGEFAHAAGIVLVEPRGTISQYLFGVRFKPQTLRLALVNASAGRIGTLADRLLLLCCAYDPVSGRYNLLIARVLQGLGLLTLLALTVLLVRLHRTTREPPGGSPQ
jgi:protein SCO1